MVGLGMGVIPLWSGTGHIWPIGRRMPMALIIIKENGMNDLILGIIIGVVLMIAAQLIQSLVL
jgi:hypothetical protein